MKYLRALIISIVVWGGASAPAAMAYVEFLVPSVFKWQSTIERESGFETIGFYMNPSISFRYFFPELNLDPEKPLAAPLTIAFGDPDWAIFYDGVGTDYYPEVANGRGSLTYDLDWTIKEWDLTVDIILSESWYGTLTASGQISHPNNARLVMHYDNFQSRPFFDPYDISEFYTGILDGFWIMDHGITVPEPRTLPLLLSGLLALVVWRRRRQQ